MPQSESYRIKPYCGVTINTGYSDVPVRSAVNPEVFRVSRLLAFWHGQKMQCTIPGQGMMTVAAMAGYGKYGDASDRYAAAKWELYTSAAEAVLQDFASRRRKSKGFRRHLREAKATR